MDLSVVLRFDNGAQLEICWMKFDDLAITWNTIDLSQEIHSSEPPLLWRSSALPALTAFAGAEVTSVERTLSELNGAPLTNGLRLGSGSSGVHIFNALDENGIDDECPSPYRPLPGASG